MTATLAIEHLSHAEHAKACAVAAANKKTLRQYVQVDYCGAPECGVIVDALDIEQKPMWKVDFVGNVRGRVTVAERKVRKCSGVDGRCQCAGEVGN